jgi:hypothetical protein
MTTVDIGGVPKIHREEKNFFFVAILYLTSFAQELRTIHKQTNISQSKRCKIDFYNLYYVTCASRTRFFFGVADK